MKKSVFLVVLIPFLLFYAMPAGAAEKEGREWQDEVIYSIMVDRFNNGSSENDKDLDVDDLTAYNGGDFAGITKKLDYLKDMGFTAIWLTPIFDNEEGGYHGYWINDFYKTEEHFGTIEEFKTLVKEAHDRDIKVILDFVVNHVGPNHPFVSDPEKKDWFHEKKEITNWKDQEEVENGWIYNLPDLNQDNPETSDYLIDAAKWWINETDIDGYRLDTVKHVPKTFWTKFASAVKEEKKDFFLIGEVWDKDPTVIASYQDTGIDGFMDFAQNDSQRTAFQKTDQSLSWLFSNLERNETMFNKPELLGQFIDNHDMSRFTSLAAANNNHPGTRWKQSLAYMYTTPGIPIIYYGSEIALNGGEDPDNRKLMDFRTDKELIEYITTLGRLRAELPALTRGDTKLLYEKDGMAVFTRTYQDETIVVALNNTKETQTVVLEKGMIEKDKELKGLLQGDLVRSEGDTYKIIIDREESEIYALTDKTGINKTFLFAIAGILVLFAIFIVMLIKRAKRKE